MNIKHIANNTNFKSPFTGLGGLFFILSYSLQAQLPYNMDMVHHNPGEVRFVTNYDKPEVIKEVGAKGKVFYLFDSGVLGVNWESFDPAALPVGSADRTWIDAKAAETTQRYNAAKAAGLEVYCMSDLLLFPKKLLEKYGMTTRFKDINDTLTQRLLREELRMMFRDFPQLDGIVVRIGETYMQDAPYHSGGINNKTSSTVIIPLMQIMREEVCVKLNKRVFFRTWWSFDSNQTTYNEVSNAVEPHANLIFSVKHCEGDFHRGNPFSKVLGTGRHKQLVEVQCAREYEGKGAFPNYIAHGVIEGFEEYKNTMPTAPYTSLRQLYNNAPLFSGVWTWSKGGGWDGPYIQNDMWNELNTWVMLNWAKNPAVSEAELFNQYATSVLGLSGTSLAQFRTLALLSADAVIRGHRSTFADIDVWWTRDQYISAPPAIPTDATKKARVLSQKVEAVQLFERIVRLADSIQMPDLGNKKFMQISARYGLFVHKIYETAFQLKYCSLDAQSSRLKIDSLLTAYDNIWAEYRKFGTDNPECPTLYTEKAFRNTNTGSIGEFVATMRQSMQGTNGTYITNLQPGILSNIITLDLNPEIGKKMYSDRTYLFTEMPSVLQNAEYVVWKNDYKNYTTNPMLTFGVNTAGTVYVAYDNRLQRPDWLTSNFAITDQSFAVQDSRLSLFQRKVKKDELVVLGHNHNQGNLNSSTLYIPFFVPDAPLSLNEYDIAPNVKLYCIDNKLNIRIPAQIRQSECVVSDISGRVVKTIQLSNETTQVQLSKGFYLIQIDRNQQLIYTNKIIL
jgi:hypothetical protein